MLQTSLKLYVEVDLGNYTYNYIAIAYIAITYIAITCIATTYIATTSIAIG